MLAKRREGSASGVLNRTSSGITIVHSTATSDLVKQVSSSCRSFVRQTLRWISSLSFATSTNRPDNEPCQANVVVPGGVEPNLDDDPG